MNVTSQLPVKIVFVSKGKKLIFQLSDRCRLALQEGTITRARDDQKRYVKAIRKMTGKHKTERS